MNDRPIGFTGQMMRAILDDKKTQTRRVVKMRARSVQTGKMIDVPVYSVTKRMNEITEQFPTQYFSNDGCLHFCQGQAGDFPMWNNALSCPYGVPGDRLWMKEPWVTERRYDHLPPSKLPKAAKIWYLNDEGDIPEWRGRYRHSRFIPKRFARINLEVTSVRVERVQDIEEGGAIVEGINYWSKSTTFNENYQIVYENYENPKEPFVGDAISSFRTLWDLINNLRGYGWDTNPWVWVVGFVRVNER